MQSGINILVIHHGGELTEKSRLKYYKGGKFELSFNQSPDILSIPMLENYIQNELGHKEFKIYRHKSGTLINDSNCMLL